MFGAPQPSSLASTTEWGAREMQLTSRPPGEKKCSMNEVEQPTGDVGSLKWGDLAVVGTYFVFVLAVGLWSSRRGKKDNLSGYFLASRNMHWIPVGASLFASNIGSGHFIGLAGTGAASGIAVAGFELNAAFILIGLGWLFLPVYTAAGVYTMPEYLRLRFGGQRIRIYLSLLSLLLYIFTKISVDLYAGALFIQRATGLSGHLGLYIAIIILLVIAAIFTIFGGLKAVIWTDFVQTVLMVVGAVILSVLSLRAVGGYHSLIKKYFQAVPSVNASLLDGDNKSCGAVREDAMHLFRSSVPGESDLPWTGMVFGLTTFAISYWCTDQVIVQRALSAKDMVHAKAGCLLAAYLKFLPLILMVFPGMAARVLYTDRVACADPAVCQRVCNSPNGCSNLAYVELVVRLLPVGLSGLMLAVMLAALMSSLTSIFNSASTLFSIDIYKRVRKRASEREQVIVGRLFVVFMVAVSIAWIPIITSSSSNQLFVYINRILSLLGPPVSAVYVLAVFWPRANEPGSFWGLMVGLAAGVIRFILELLYTPPSCGSGLLDDRPGWIRSLVDNLNFLNFAIVLFCISGTAVIIFSLLTEPIPSKCLYRLTFWSRFSTKVRRPLPGSGADKHQQTVTDAAEKTAAENSSDTAEKMHGGQARTADIEAARKQAQLLAEEPKQKMAVDVGAVVTAGVAIGIYAYYR